MALSSKDRLLALIAISIPLAALVEWSPTLRWVVLLTLLGASIAAGVITLGVVGSSQAAGHQQRADGQRSHLAVPQAWDAESAWLATTSAYKASPILPSSFIASDSLDELLSWIVRDFVTSWYRGINQTERFAGQVDALIRKGLVASLVSLQGQDIVEALVLRIVPILTRHLKSFSDAERSIRGKRLNRAITESDELDLAIAKKYNDGRLHLAASLASSDPEFQRQEYLGDLVSRLLPDLLPGEVVQCKPTSILIRELLSRVLLGPILSLVADPDTWNQILESYGKTVLRDRKTVRKLRAALDEHALPTPSSPKLQVFPQLSPQDDERKFERFIRAIRLCSNLSDARRLRSEIASQLTRESLREEQDTAFLKRLETGKRILDQRVNTLAAGGDQVHAAPSNYRARNQVLPGTSNTKLVDILRDAMGLSYFMEYMDRQKMITSVQFWIVVDGFRDPLEDASNGHDQPDAPGQWTSSDRHDIAQVFDTYLSQPEIRIPHATREAVQEFLSAKDKASPAQYGKARGALLRAQESVLEEMQEKHFPNFRRSDLFFKFLASDSPSKQIPSASSHSEERTQHITSDDQVLSGPAQRPSMSHPPGTDKPAPKHPATQPSRNSRKPVLRPDHPLIAKKRSSFDTDESEAFDNADTWHAADSDAARPEDQAVNETRVVEAVEAALNDIMTDKMSDSYIRDTASESPGSGPPSNRDPLFSDDFLGPKKAKSPQSEKKKPSIASLGLVSASSRIGVFMDDDLFGHEEKFIEDEHADPEEASENELLNDIHEAAPGDLGLSEAISALTVDIDRLNAQESVIDALTRKAELINNHSELRILGKSRSSLQREIRRKGLQKQQYLVQESDSSLYGRAKVDIKSVMVGRDEDGQEFAFYMVEVNRKAGEHVPAASWVVARRYSEFHILHQRLRRMYPAVRNLNFPRRRLVMKLQTDFLQRRRAQLEEYLQGLLRLPAVCTSRALRAFLSQRPIATKDDPSLREEREDLVSRIYSSITDGMDEFLGNMPVFDQLSIAGQSLLSTAATQAGNARVPGVRDGEQPIDLGPPQEAQAEIEAFETQTFEPFVKPICDLFLEVFELNQSANWLRGRTLVIVLQQLLGGTIERKVRDMSKGLTSDDALLKYITALKDTLWPHGSLQTQRKLRTAAEKKKTRTEASIVLATLLPEVAGGVVGRANAHAAGRRIFAASNNGRLNTHLVFEIFDEITAILFPDKTRNSV